MFVGEFPYRVDDKGRIPIPPPFRRELTDGGYLTPWAEGCIALHPRATFEEIRKTLPTAGLPKENIRALARTIFTQSDDVERLDGQGRVMLPPDQRVGAGITDAAVVVGVNDYVEIWSPERWKELKASQDNPWKAIEKLEQQTQQVSKVTETLEQKSQQI